MKTTFAIAAVAGFAAAASAQSIYITASNNLPADGEVVTLDVVLDATDFSGTFVAWHQYNFNVDISASGEAAGIGAAIASADQAGQAAASDNTGDGVANFGPFGPAWETGRRPGAFPGAGALAGGNQFGPLQTTATDDLLTGDAGGSIGGRQGSLDAEGNVNLHRGRVYEAFRFTFTYSDAFGLVTFNPADVVLNVYNVAGTGGNAFVDASNIGSVTVGVPTPASAALLGLGGLAAARRRRA